MSFSRNTTKQALLTQNAFQLLASLSWGGRKSLLLPGQLYTFCLLVCQPFPDIDVNASLRS